MMKINKKFPGYHEFDPLIPVWCVTPDEGRCIHRFFDTSPFSPSQRYMAVLRLPQEERLPRPGEIAHVVLIDLHDGTEKTVAETMGWEPQMGANINWGATDCDLYFNDVDPETWEPFCVKLNPHTGEKKRLGGTVYRISPDGKHVISACMKRMRRTQYGYGVVVPDEYVPRNLGLRPDDGLYITDTDTGKCRILVSVSEVFEKAKIDKEKYKNIECYGFHCKYNAQGDRIMFSMRGFDITEHEPWNMLSDAMYFWIVTLRPDGSDIHIAVGPEEWHKGGHHTTWQPDGRRLSMNLAVDGNINGKRGRMYFMQVDYDGKNYGKIHETLLGSGHPTLHPNGRHILTDTYEWESGAAFGDGTVPLRFINITDGTEKTAVRVNVRNPAAQRNTVLRVDPHPAWSPDHRYAALNGFVNGTRRVFIADFHDILI
jgi:hypothetical protein